jgi:hypothetical protein
MRAILVGLTLLSLISAREARADCAAPSPQWSVLAGDVVPAKATLFYFAPRWQAVTIPPMVSAGGSAVPSTWSVESENEAFITYRLRFETSGKQWVKVSLEGRGDVRFRVEPWRRPAESATARALARKHDQWTCSHTDILPVEIDTRASAFRVEWFDTRSGSEDAGHGTAIFPRQAEEFFQWTASGEKIPDPIAHLELGHSNCFGGYSVPKDNLDHLSLRITPLYRDGTEGAVLLVGGREEVLHCGLQSVVEDLHDDRLAEPHEVSSIARPLAAERVWAVAAALGVLLGFAGFVVLRRRRASRRRAVVTALVGAVLCGALAVAAGLASFPYWLIHLAGGVVVVLASAIVWAWPAKR